MTHEIDTTAPRYMQVEPLCSFCDRPIDGPPLVILDELHRGHYCSVRCVENAIEAAGMAAAKAALR